MNEIQGTGKGSRNKRLIKEKGGSFMELKFLIVYLIILTTAVHSQLATKSTERILKLLLKKFKTILMPLLTLFLLLFFLRYLILRFMKQIKITINNTLYFPFQQLPSPPSFFTPLPSPLTLDAHKRKWIQRTNFDRKL